MTVGYWNIRGLAAPIRMMVMYGGATLNSVNYDLKVKPEGGFDGSCWFDVKPDLKAKNPLINLPYVIDGDVILTQSNACCLYVGRKLGLLGNNEAICISRCPAFIHLLVSICLIRYLRDVSLPM